MSQNKNLFIIESSIGVHHSINDKFEADVLSFTFLPLGIKKDNSSKDSYSYLMPKKINPLKLNSLNIFIDDLASFIKENKYQYIFIGTDLDITGNFSARIIYDYLTSNNFSNNQIIRVPLTSEGFSFVSDFWNNELMNFWLQNISDEMEYIQHSKKVLGKHGIGRRYPLILNEILNAPKEVENLNPSGTSSITYLFKKKIKEK